MHSKNTIIIYDWRELLAKGIQCILHEHFQNIIVKITHTQQDFVKFAQQLNPTAVFINEKKIHKIIQTNPELLQNTKIIVIGKRYPIMQNLKFTFILPPGASEEYLISNFSKYILDENYSSSAEDEPDLTAREKEIVKLIALGYTNQQIAEKLFISPHTVTTHRKNITKKLGIKTISGLTIYAILNNLISIEELEKAGIK